MWVSFRHESITVAESGAVMHSNKVHLLDYFVVLW